MRAATGLRRDAVGCHGVACELRLTQAAGITSQINGTVLPALYQSHWHQRHAARDATDTAPLTDELS